MFGDGIGGWVADVEKFEGGPVDAIEDDDHEEEPPGLCAWEEIGVDAARVLQDEADGGLLFGITVFRGVDQGKEFEHAPEDEAKEERVAIKTQYAKVVRRALLTLCFLRG